MLTKNTKSIAINILEVYFDSHLKQILQQHRQPLSFFCYIFFFFERVRYSFHQVIPNDIDRSNVVLYKNHGTKGRPSGLNPIVKAGGACFAHI